MVILWFKMLVIFGVCLAVATPLRADAPTTQPAPLELSLTFQNSKGRLMGQPPVMNFGSGFMLVEIKWTSPYTDKDAVFYRVWIRGEGQDWASANAPKGVDESGATGWRQYAYLGQVREGGSKGTRMKVHLGYRPAGLSSYPLKDAGPTGLVELPEVMPLPPGTYPFTVVVQRVGQGGVTETAQRPLEVVIKGEATPGTVYGMADYQIIQRSAKDSGAVACQLIGVPTSTSWKATVTKGGQVCGSASGTVSAAVTPVTIAKVPTGGPYEVEISAGALSRKFANVYVGDIWIISGQSNAVGCGYDVAQGAKPLPGVHYVDPHYNIQEWAVARDGFFQHTVGAWVTGAQAFYKETQVPVGLVGHAAGSKTMDYFYDAARADPYFLRPLVERHGMGAAAFFWYQGESDTFQPEAQQSYGVKLEGLVKAMRKCTRNPELLVGVCQLGRYMWFRDDHFADLRETQRQFVLGDKRSVLFSTMPYEVNPKDKIHLMTEGYVLLGQQIGAQMIDWERTGKVMSPGPVVQGAKFEGGARTRLVVRFTNAKGLQGKASAEEWFITDTTHGGFKKGGFVEIANITIDKDKEQVVIELKSAPVGKTAVSYGYRSDVGGSLANGPGFPAACFVGVAVVAGP